MAVFLFEDNDQLIKFFCAPVLELQVLESGLDMFAFAVFWLVTKYKNKYIDLPPPTARPATTAAPPNATEAASTPTTSTHVSSTATSAYSTTESYNFLLEVPAVIPQHFD
jgi:hypothetical protein